LKALDRIGRGPRRCRSFCRLAAEAPELATPARRTA